jgi:peptide-methionine (S)-S-oxide reductase
MSAPFLAVSLGIMVALAFGGGAPAQAPQEEKAAASQEKTDAAQGQSKKASAAKEKSARAKTTKGKSKNASATRDKSEKANVEPVTTEKATFGGGCFWCMEAVFEQVPGVKSVVSGYAGGTVPRPNYEQVCTGLTGHAEVVQITYDPKVVSYEQLLDIFFHTHDPTTVNRQGPDEGTQYRSIILYHNDEQKQAALKMYEKLTASRAFPAPIVTQLVPLKKFYPAEKYHQNYFRNHPEADYCQIYIVPKLYKLQNLQLQKRFEQSQSASDPLKSATDPGPR